MKRIKQYIFTLFIFVCFSLLCTAVNAESTTVKLTDVTSVRSDVCTGEAKIMVSIKDSVYGETPFIRLKFRYDGKLNYKSATLLRNVDDTIASSLIVPDNAQSKVRSLDEYSYVSFEWSTEIFEECDLFVLTFEGKAGDSVTVYIDECEDYAMYSIDGEDYFPGNSASLTATATAKGNSTKTSLSVCLDGISDFADFASAGFSPTDIFVRITSENIFSDRTVFYTSLNNVISSVGGHRDKSSTDYALFTLKTVFPSNDTYTIQITAPGYTTVKMEGVDFASPITITNSELIPGDVDGNGTVDRIDAQLCRQKISEGCYDLYYDFNRDGLANERDIAIFGSVGTELPTSPRIMRVSGINDFIMLEWEPVENYAVTGYIIKYGKDEARLDNEIVVGAKVYSCKFTLLEPKTKYYFCVAAINRYGTGEPSETVSCYFEGKNNAVGGSGGGPAPQIMVMPSTSTSGKSFTTTVDIRYNHGFCKAYIIIKYDSSSLTLTRVAKSELSADSSLRYDIADGEAVITLDNGSTDIKEDGAILKLTFKVKNNTSDGIIPIYISSEDLEDCTDSQGYKVSAEFVDGYTVVGKDAVIPDVSGDGILDGKDVTDIQGGISKGNNDLENGDMDGDNRVGMSDLNLIMALLRKISEAIRLR